MGKARKVLVGLLCALSVGFSALAFGACEETGGANSTQSSSSSSQSTKNESSSPSEGLEYMLSEDKTYYIVTDIGECSDTDIIIPSEYKGKPVKSIGDDAFYWCVDIRSVNIPNSVTSIGKSSFGYCYNLTNIEIGNSVKNIGERTFYHCSKLIEVYNKSSLVITLGDINNGYVGYYAKKIYTKPYVSKLSTNSDGYVIYTDGEEKILVGYTGAETDLILPNGITEINQYAFWNCDTLTRIEIPDSVTSIGDYTFADCDGLTSLTFTGTAEEWNAIQKGNNWKNDLPATKIVCKDEEVKL